MLSMETVLSIVLFFLCMRSVHCRCYTPNGSDRNEMWNVSDGWYYAPCNPSAKVSMCCAIGEGRAGSKNSCLESGLCLGGSVIWRESCTDPTWQNPACIKLFVNGTGFDEAAGVQLDKNGDPISDVLVTQCSDGSFCSGSNNLGCCAQNQGVFIVNGVQTEEKPGTESPSSASPNPSPSESSTDLPSSSTSLSESSRSSVSSTALSTSSFTSQSLPTSSPTQSIPSPTTSVPSSSAKSTSSSELSIRVKVGIGVAAAAAAVVIVLAAWWALRKREKRAVHSHTGEKGYDRIMLDSKGVDASKYRTEMEGCQPAIISSPRAYDGKPVELQAG